MNQVRSRNVAHDKKIIHEKQKHGEDLTQDAARISQPGKKTARDQKHGAPKKTEAEEGGIDDVKETKI